MESPSVRIESIFKGGSGLTMKGIRKSLTLKWMIFPILLATIPLAVAGLRIIQICQNDLKKSIIDGLVKSPLLSS